MLKKGYLARLVLAIGLMGSGVILGFYGIVYQNGLIYILSFFIFGFGVMYLTTTELRKLNEGLSGKLIRG